MVLSYKEDDFVPFGDSTVNVDDMFKRPSGPSEEDEERMSYYPELCTCKVSAVAHTVARNADLSSTQTILIDNLLGTFGLNLLTGDNANIREELGEDGGNKADDDNQSISNELGSQGAEVRTNSKSNQKGKAFSPTSNKSKAKSRFSTSSKSSSSNDVYLIDYERYPNYREKPFEKYEALTEWLEEQELPLSVPTNNIEALTWLNGAGQQYKAEFEV
ncbi:hypothetical protein G7Y89_g2588 [Cudoniella acicularis]|uniref:Uncharacterized protein n=1 Tax=Cudoniella acicularis TaxID=354080 RepID=A0A8H4RU67_9HELO|nr:hypothetical protein G7Y89_g2588 [Cudoniella acicularis]